MEPTYIPVETHVQKAHSANIARAICNRFAKIRALRVQDRDMIVAALYAVPLYDERTVAK